MNYRTLQKGLVFEVVKKKKKNLTKLRGQKYMFLTYIFSLVARPKNNNPKTTQKGWGGGGGGHTNPRNLPDSANRLPTETPDGRIG